ncbi:hypothetical protein ACKFKG_07465 [Phormidesmis sp. 146-35]
MKRNQFPAIFAVAVVLVGIGTTAIASANLSPNEQIAVERLCNPGSFTSLLNKDFRGVNLSTRQSRLIQNAYQSYVAWYMKNMGDNKCWDNNEGVLTAPFVGKYAEYEAVVRKTLNPRQLTRWDKNIRDILAGRR